MSLVKLIVIVVIIAGACLFVWQMGWVGKATEAGFNTHFAAGQALYQATKYQEAIAEYDKALQLDPKDSDAPNALMRKAECYKELKQPDEAKKTYEQILSDYPNCSKQLRDGVTAALEKLKLGQP